MILLFIDGVSRYLNVVALNQNMQNKTLSILFES